MTPLLSVYRHYSWNKMSGISFEMEYLKNSWEKGYFGHLVDTQIIRVSNKGAL